MQLVVTNISSDPVYLRDFYKELAAGESITTTRDASDLSTLQGLIEALDAGTVTVSVTPSAAEVASGFLTPPQAVQAQDMAPVAAADIAAGLVILRADFAAGVGGAPDDVQVYAVDSLPFKFRVVMAWGLVSTAVVGSTLNVYTQAAGAGTLLAGPIASALVGSHPATGPNASALAVPGATEGLFVRRSDSGVAGEVFLLVRRES